MPDRRAALLASPALNGIDFVEVDPGDQTRLVVHFLNHVDVTLAATVPVTISGGEAPAEVPATAGTFAHDDAGRRTLSVSTPFAGDFSSYELRIESAQLDPYFAAARFSFKAACPSTLDCAAPAPDCPATDAAAPEIDYLAKDFLSFKRALEDYSAVAYPDWRERAEADLGVVLLELMAAAGDDLSYYQDRVAAEGALATATQRRSVLRHARLVDYEPRPSRSARVKVQVDVVAGPVPAGALVTAPTPEGASIPFELGHGLADSAPLRVDPRWNGRDAGGAARILPYWWDDGRRCIEAGATEMWVRGHGFAFPAADVQAGRAGLQLLIDTDAAEPVDPPVREIVELTQADEIEDPLFGVALTHLRWSTPLARDHDLTRTRLAGNLLDATQGQRFSERFTADVPGCSAVRQGPNAGCEDPMPIYLYTLRQGRLAWLGDVPEVLVEEPATTAGDPAKPWRWRRRLLDAPVFEPAFTVEPARYARGDYDGDDADSLRFGDGVFGERPAPGTRFEITYRTTVGAQGNVAAGAITGVDPAMAHVIARAGNPFAAEDGGDEEPLDVVRRRAPEAFKAKLLRAVRAADYNAAAKEPAWVLDAGTTFRWTGSWLTVFSTALPRAGGLPRVEDLTGLLELLNRRRLAGYDVHSPRPRYVGLDLVVTICARAWALRGEVEAAVRTELGTGRRADGAPAFFAPGRFRFGTPLERSALEVACQHAAGVAGVVSIALRRRGVTRTFEPMEQTLPLARDEVARCDGDPSRPERGSLSVVVQGGK